MDTALSPKYNISLYAGSGSVDGVQGDHIIIAPPYNSTREEILRIAELTQKVIEDVFSRITTS
mgnify:CR=1 FL=1